MSFSDEDVINLDYSDKRRAEIIQILKSTEFDLLIIGRHGHGTLKDSMLGSTARRVLRRINIPALLVPLPDK